MLLDETRRPNAIQQGLVANDFGEIHLNHHLIDPFGNPNSKVCVMMLFS